MPYTVEISAKAQRELAALPPEIQRDIGGAIDALADNPRPHGHKRLRGYRDILRIRVRDYRILYRVHDATICVVVVRIGNRSEVYRHLETLT